MRQRCRPCYVTWGLGVLLLVTLFINQPDSPPYQGAVIVHDGDSFRLNGQKIRLWAIDAPEIEQTCTKSGKKWACGQKAKAYLQELTRNQPITCDQKSTNHDRIVAQCFAGDADLSQAMVRGGYALALPHISTRYVPDEEYAKETAAGLWAGSFHEPWVWRK